MLTKRYLVSVKNLDAIFTKIKEGVAPSKFNNEHLKSIGFASSGDRGLTPLLKDLGFLTPDGTPTERYHQFRDRSRSKAVLGIALRDAYSDIFHISEFPKPADRPAVEGLFKSKHNSTDRVAQLQAATFFALLRNADISTKSSTDPEPDAISSDERKDSDDNSHETQTPSSASLSSVNAQLHYTIQIHLPATKEIEVFNAIFRSLRENLLS